MSPTQASYGPLSSGSELGPYYLDVSTQPGDCNWTASSTMSWIRVLYSSSGKGAGRVFYDVQNNKGSTSRTGEVIE